MTFSKNNFVGKRVLSSLIAIPCFVLAVYGHVFSYFVLFMAIMVLAMRECYNLFALCGNASNKILGIFLGLLAYTLVFLCAGGWVPISSLYLLVPACSTIFLVALSQQRSTPTISLDSIAYTLLGIVYAGIPFSLLHLLAFCRGYYSYQIVMGLILLLWANDTGAYLVGSSIGKYKILPKISPKKTWEGSLGGIILVLLVSSLLAQYFDVLDEWTWKAIGGVVAITGTLGDLIESMFKRSAGIKDTSNLIPGHGGILDRFDSFLLAVPVVLALIKLLF